MEENIISFVKNELKKIQKDLGPNDSGCSGTQREEEEEMDAEDEEQSRDSLRKITVSFLRKMNQEKLANLLQSSKKLNIKLKVAKHQPKPKSSKMVAMFTSFKS